MVNVFIVRGIIGFLQFFLGSGKALKKSFLWLLTLIRVKHFILLLNILTPCNT